MANVNYKLIISCALIVISLSLYIFYLNRFLAFLFNILLRFWGWSAGSTSVWIEFRSIHFSLVTGRILFRDFRYHSSDLTARAVTCQLEWRYWIRRPMQEEDLAEYRANAHRNEASDTKFFARSLPCRVHMRLSGLELYIYNRVASYDHVVSEMEKQAKDENTPQTGPEHSGFSIYRIFSKSSAPLDSAHVPAYPPSSAAPTSVRRRSFVQRALDRVRRQLPTLDAKDLLPLSIAITKAIIICGNASTPNLLVIDSKAADGVIGIVPSRSKHDIYKQVFDMKFQTASVQFLENEDYHGPMIPTGERIRDRLAKSKVSRLRWLSQLAYSNFAKLWRRHNLAQALPEPRSEAPRSSHVRTATERMRKAFKKHQEVADDIDYTTYEYAVERNLLEAPTLDVVYYIDNVGTVPYPMGGISAKQIDMDPEWGIDVVVHSGSLKYGPWSDRQRNELQRTFLPTLYQDSQPNVPLKPGDKRTWTALKVFIELREATTLVIPFRESSKDWQWDGKVSVERPAKREPAYLTMKVGDGSTVSYNMPMVANAKGFEPVLEVHLDSVSMSSSLNDTRFLSAESCRIRAELPTPLAWKALRQWKVGITLRTPVVYLLRDHVNMFTDLSTDWSAGPTAPIHTWIPMIYSIDLTLRNYTINLYANDFNIIDTPLQKDTNVLFSLRGETMKNCNRIPSDTHSPTSTNIPFSVEAPSVDVYLSLPRWNTHWSNDDDLRGHLGKIGLLRLDGSYTLQAIVAPGNLEQLQLDIEVEDLVYKAFGWTIRSFMVLRDNYLGSFTHFHTLSEHLFKRARSQSTGDPVNLQYREGASNQLQVILNLQCKRSTLVLPAGLLGYETRPDKVIASARGLGKCLVIHVPQQDLVLRTHDDFMEMNMSMPVMKACVEQNIPESILLGGLGYQMTHASVVVDGFDIVANRLFGPPPHIHTYVCVWDLSFGNVKASMSASDALSALAAVQSFAFNMEDIVNAPAPELIPELLPDVTFLNVALASICTVWNAGPSAVEIMLPSGMNMQSNDLAGCSYRKLTSLVLPSVEVRFLTQRAGQRSWVEAAKAQLKANINMYDNPLDWEETARRQRLFLVEQDRPSGRIGDVLEGGMPIRSNRATVHGRNYLPRITSPRRSNKAPQSSRARRKNPSELRSAVFDLSDESDVPQGSEADRDAYIAQANPQFRPAGHESIDDDSLSEGDESDDTDFVTLEDQVPELEDLPVGDLTELDLCHHYESFDVTRPSGWSTSSLIRTKTVHIQDFPDGTFAGTVTRDKITSHPWIKTARSSNQGRMTVDLHVAAVQLVLIPTVLISALVHLVDDVKLARRLGPELQVDGIMLSHVDGLRKDTLSSVLVLNAEVDEMVVRTMHSIAPQKGISSSAGYRAFALALLLRRMTASLNGGSVRGSLEQVSTNAYDLTPARRSRNAISFITHTTCGIALANAKMEYAKNAIEATLGQILLDVTHQAPDSIMQIVTCITQAVDEIHPVLTHFMKWDNRHNDSSLVRILEFASRKKMVDLLATTQPAYFVQQGLPHQLRTDITFKLLLYIRTCLSDVRPLDWAQLRVGVMESVNVGSGMSSLGRLLDTLGIEADSEASASTLWQSIHPNKTTENQPSPSPITRVSAHLGSLKANILDPDGDSPSSLILTSVTVRSDMHSRNTSTSLASNTLKPPPDAMAFVVPSVQLVQVHNTIDMVKLSIQPHMLDFIREAAQLEPHSVVLSPQIKLQSNNLLSGQHTPTPGVGYVLEVVTAIQDVNIRAAADTLTIETGLKGLTSFVSRNEETGLTQAQSSTGASVVIQEMFIRALSTVEQASGRDRGVLASLIFRGTKANIIHRAGGSSANALLRSALGLDTVSMSVPRSAVRLYRFVEDWKLKFLPKLQATAQELVTEMRAPTKPQLSTAMLSNMTVQVQVQVTSFLVALQVMRGTWLSWKVVRAVFYGRSAPASRSSDNVRHFGMKLASQAIGVSADPELTNVSTKARVKLDIPTILLTGHQDVNGVNVFSSMDQLHVTIKPSHLDTVLTVQQKFGQDFTDIMTLIQHNREEPVRAPPKTPANQEASTLKFNVHVKMRGLRVGLRGAHSTLLLECEDIKGGIKNEHAQLWQIRLSDVAFSVAQRERDHSPRQSFSRTHRSAFVILDLSADGEHGAAPDFRKTLRVDFPKVHAVLQPRSIAEIADLVNDLQRELRLRKEERATEMAEFKAKTLNVMRTFDVHGSELRPQTGQPLLSQYTISLQVRNIGGAFPLAIDSDVKLPTSSPRTSAGMRAFLFSVKSVGFGAHLGESGQATVKDFAIQFVPHFRPSLFSDYDGLTHATHNRIVYPEMTAQLRTEKVNENTRLSIVADVSGFILDLDSSLPDYIFSLVDVYQHGKQQVERINASIPSSTSRDVPLATNPPKATDLPAADVCGSVTFRSGKIRLHSSSDMPSPRGRTVSFTRNNIAFSELGTDIIKLPEVTVWTEYHGASTVSCADANAERPYAELMFKSTIHSSQNTLFPANILPFLSEFNTHLETRMKQQPGRSSSPPTLPDLGGSNDSVPITSSTPANLRISVGLQIDKSHLELTCQPDVNVNAGVHWESGGFFLSLEPGMRQMSFSGAVKGLAVSLRHGFLSEACATVEARGLTFSTSFSKEYDGAPTISLLVDTELVGGLRFSRLQDLLCFKAVWLDRIPVFSGPPINEASPTTPVAAAAVTKSEDGPSSPFLTALCVRVRRFNLDVDLGQSISVVALHLEQIVVQTRLTHISSELQFLVGNMDIQAVGNISGRADVPNFMFRTTRVMESAHAELPGHRMLQLEMTSGPLNIALESEHQDLLKYRAEPVRVTIFDDWSSARNHASTADNMLRLSFVVDGSTIAAAITVSSIPRLMVYVDKFTANLELQRDGASRESKAFRIAQAPKPDNALSAVAEAMLHSARTRYEEAETAISYIIQQRMDLKLSSLHLALFPRRMDDTEMAQFIGRDVEAHLERTVEPGGDMAKRDLRLAFASMAVSRFTGLNHTLAKKDLAVNSSLWIPQLTKGAAEANIFGLPSMHMVMSSDEHLQSPRTLEYDFKSTFRNTPAAKNADDIYISLNVSLYSWLTFLRKNFAREMDDLKAAKSTPSLTPATSKMRKMLPAGLNWVTSPGSTMPLSPQSESLRARSPAPLDSSNALRLDTQSSNESTDHDLPEAMVVNGLPRVSSTLPEYLVTTSVPIAVVPSTATDDTAVSPTSTANDGVHRGIRYQARSRSIERLTMRQLGEATPDVMHPFFMKKAGFSLEDSLPQYVHEYAAQPLEEIMKALLELYSKQLKVGQGRSEEEGGS